MYVYVYIFIYIYMSIHVNIYIYIYTYLWYIVMYEPQDELSAKPVIAENWSPSKVIH